jgi:hypothetical protein
MFEALHGLILPGSGYIKKEEAKHPIMVMCLKVSPALQKYMASI